MSERLKIALVGCGGMGRRHLRGIATLYQSAFSNVELVAVCDLNQENAAFLADEAAELLGTRPRIYADIATMVREVPAAELFGGDRVWSYTLDLNEVDPRIVATEYHELAECVRTGARPEVTAEEGRADVALVYAPFEAGRLGRPVTLDDLVDGRADVYLREIDALLGLLDPTIT